ncbi:hypothetical protein DV451_004096 [Geotrichum candidum]|uniref:Mitochondrial Rho GTPase 1 n=1 Tax=Geotrichum candidum TaxID=1173061 RepID=A0A9P5G2R0_GEOCN|nr:hypothetical protein DV451_004096 [Geotrichum candidum]KAF5109662.1 hypothetical protein DV454_004963 [Geotrichum candidum]KAF7497932.1 hypothetical protein DV113_004044 [Geotrichum candidum]KAI9214200.1 hypothetical protein DS838_000952 [Geotrichum bryndzae]
MKFMTTNFVQCAVRSCSKTTDAFPLQYTDLTLIRQETEFDSAFILNILPRLDWNALVKVASELGNNALPADKPEIENPDLEESQQLLKDLHNLLVESPISTIIVDTSADPMERATLQQEIKRANVIWLVYSGHYTCERITLFWMPFFRSMGVNFLKNALLEISPTAVTATGITEEGFILLNKLYAEKGRHETTWGILRSFHYTDSLSLEDTFLYPKLDVPVNSSVELSPEGYRFLVDLFVLFDKDNDGGLNDLELESLFKPSPGIPKLWQEFNFPQTTVRNDLGNITLQGWLAQWSMTTYLDYKTTTAYLALLGFESQHQSMRKITDALKVTRPRKQRNPSTRSYRNSVVDRNVFNCYVVGSPGSGKTSLLTAFLNRPFTEIYSPTIKPFTVVNSVEMTGGKQCYLILEELGELEPAVLENQSRLDSCDVLCFVYDSSDPDSFTYLVELCQKNPLLERLPAVYVALKADLDRQQQRSSMQPDAYTSKLNMASPLHVSVQWPQALNELFVQLSEAALRPGSATPHVDLEEEESNLIPMAAIALGLGAFAVTLSWYLRSFSHGSH